MIAVVGVAKLRRSGRLDAEDTALVNLTGGDREPREPVYDARWLRRSDDGWVPEAEYTAWTRV